MRFVVLCFFKEYMVVFFYVGFVVVFVGGDGLWVVIWVGVEGFRCVIGREMFEFVEDGVFMGE